MHIADHPILGQEDTPKLVKVRVDGREMLLPEGKMIAAALLAEGIRVNRYTRKHHEPRGIFCGIGQCTDCVMVVDGRRNVRTCITPVREGMVIETQRPADGGNEHD